MRLLNLTLALSTLATLLPSSAYSETTPNRPSLKQNTRTLAYVTDNSVQSSLIEIGKRQDKQLDITCTDQFKADYSVETISIFRPIVFPTGAEHPTEGVWLYKYEFNRCGRISTYNAAAEAQNGAKPKFLALLPGSTFASPPLQIDAMRMVVFKVMLEAKVKNNRDCDDLAITDTAISEMPTISKVTGLPGRWEEQWNVRYCKEISKVPVCFTPNAKGTYVLTQPCKTTQQGNPQKGLDEAKLDLEKSSNSTQ